MPLPLAVRFSSISLGGGSLWCIALISYALQIGQYIEPHSGSPRSLRQILVIYRLQRKSIGGRICGSKIEVLANFSPG